MQSIYLLNNAIGDDQTDQLRATKYILTCRQELLAHVPLMRGIQHRHSLRAVNITSSSNAAQSLIHCLTT